MAGKALNGVFRRICALAEVQTRAAADRDLLARFRKATGQDPCCYTVHVAQATHTLLDAIAASDGSRRSVTSKLLDLRTTDGIIGDFLQRHGRAQVQVGFIHGNPFDRPAEFMRDGHDPFRFGAVYIQSRPAKDSLRAKPAGSASSAARTSPSSNQPSTPRRRSSGSSTSPARRASVGTA